MPSFAGLFDRLDPATIAELDASRRTARFAAGQDIMRIGDAPDALHCIRRGAVKVWRPVRSGATMTFYYMGEGAPIGLVAIARDGRMGMSVTAATAVETRYWPAPLARRLLHADARFAANGMDIVAQALAKVSDRLEDATGASARQQIARALLRLAGGQADADATIAIGVSRQDVADLTGTTLYTVSRTLSDWGRRGLIESGRRRVEIRDRDALAALADGDE